MQSYSDWVAGQGMNFSVLIIRIHNKRQPWGWVVFRVHEW